MQDTRAAFIITSLFFLCFFLPSPLLATERYMQLVAPGQGWTVSKDGLFWTQDDGSHWKNISPPGVRYMNDIFFLDTSHGWALFEGEKERPDGNTDIVFNIAATSDGGATWTLSLVNTKQQEPDQFDGTGWIDFVDPQHGWLLLRGKTSVAFSWGWLLTTNDGGKTWQQLPDAPIAGRPSFSTPTDGWLAGGAGGDELYVTRDGGKTWQGADLAAPKSANGADRPAYGRPEFKDTKHGYLPVTFRPSNYSVGIQSSTFVLFATADGGQSWKVDRVLPDLRETSGDANLPLTTMADSVLIVKRVSVSPYLVLTKVAANGEVSELEARAAWDASVREISFASAVHGWILTGSGRLLSTVDGGAAWKWLQPGRQPRDLPPPPPNPTRTPLKKLGEGTLLPPPGRPPQLRYEPTVEPPPLSPQLYVAPHLGFDHHQVETTDKMQTWFNSSPFYDVGFYVGGANYCYKLNNTTKTCTIRLDPNLIPSWVSTVQGQGWGLMPIWVGPQAPCNKNNFVLFSNTPATAQAQGVTEADSASTAMTTLGLAGSVIFYDLELYSAAAGSPCSLAVQAFLRGTYSSEASTTMSWICSFQGETAIRRTPSQHRPRLLIQVQCTPRPEE